MMNQSNKDTNNFDVEGIQPNQCIYDFVVKDEDNNDVSLSMYRGKVLLIINSATECGFTEQYDELQPMFDRYESAGLMILDFPCNQFGRQAPGGIKEIIKYCDMEYAITFPILNKVDVNGPNADPLFTFLKDKKNFKGFQMEHKLASAVLDLVSAEFPDYESTSDIKWNFAKFLVSRDGTVVERYEPTALSAVIEERVLALL